MLEEQDPAALAAANQMLTYLKVADPDMTDHEADHGFVECATFADDEKYHGEMWQSDFHFKTTPYVTEGEESDYKVKTSIRNITIAQSDITEWLSGKGGDDYKDHYLYTFLMNKFENNEDVAKSYALRLFVHYAGDIMQPFHNENLYDSEFSEGDSGANKFELPYHYGADELHALIDNQLYTQHKYIARPFTAETWDSFQTEVTGMMDTYPVTDKETYENIDYEAQHVESYDLSHDLYNGKLNQL